MAYTRTTWVSGETPLSADNMNNIEDLLELIISAAQFYLGSGDGYVTLGTYAEWVAAGCPVPESDT